MTQLLAVAGMPEVRAGDDLAELVAARVRLRDGDVVAVTSKVVSKAEGLVRTGELHVAVAQETSRVVASRGATVIARMRTGLVLAGAGVDSSNVEPGHLVVLPPDPDSSARTLRERLRARTGCNVAVVVTDTAGRPWRLGQSDIAVGCAGIAPIEDHAGRWDRFGNQLLVTATATADEVAAAADLVKGKLRQVPVAVLRGLQVGLLAPEEHGPGAAALVRPPAEDLFGLGAREAVAAALDRTDAVALAAFPRDRRPPADLARLAATRLDPMLARLATLDADDDLRWYGLVRSAAFGTSALLAVAAAAERLCAAAVSFGYPVIDEPSALDGPVAASPPPGWRVVLRLRLGEPP